MLAEEGKAKAVAFDEIDKAPEEKKRGITIATVGILFSYFICAYSCVPSHFSSFIKFVFSKYLLLNLELL